MYNYGEEVPYCFDLLKADDYEDLQLFQCGNDKLDNHIRCDVIKDHTIVDRDGLYFKFTNISDSEIIAITSLATSGILIKVDTYSRIIPAIKIDVLAVHEKYQKMHYNEDSETSDAADDHYYFSDEILGSIVSHCKKMIETYALADYIVVYADRKAYRYYERNGFDDFGEFMMKEENMEVSENMPMYLDLNN